MKTCPGFCPGPHDAGAEGKLQGAGFLRQKVVYRAGGIAAFGDCPDYE
jgi:hypothetical protein